MVYAAVGRAGGLDAAMIDSTIGLLRGSVRRLRMPLLLGLPLLMLLVRGLLLARGLLLRMLLPLLRFAVLLSFLFMLWVGRSNRPEHEEQNSRTDKNHWFHKCRLHYGDFMRGSFVAPGAVVVSGSRETKLRIRNIHLTTTECNCRLVLWY